MSLELYFLALDFVLHDTYDSYGLSGVKCALICIDGDIVGWGIAKHHNG
jgi:hypothetical protein